jgi:hypothetical protein
MNTQFSKVITLFIALLFLFSLDLIAEDSSQDQRIKELEEKLKSVTEEVQKLKSTRESDAKLEEIE